MNWKAFDEQKMWVSMPYRIDMSGPHFSVNRYDDEGIPRFVAVRNTLEDAKLTAESHAIYGRELLQ